MKGISLLDPLILAKKSFPSGIEEGDLRKEYVSMVRKFQQIRP